MCHSPPALFRFLAISVPLLLVMVFCSHVLEIIAYAEVASWAAVAAWWKVIYVFDLTSFILFWS